MKIDDFLSNEKVKKYVLYVYHRWKSSSSILHIRSKFGKRTPEFIKEMENVRERFHKEALEFLKAEGFDENEISIFLENECEKETKRILSELKKGECYCGCCRIIMKVKDFHKHEQNKFHIELSNYVSNLHLFYWRIQYENMKEKIKNEGNRETKA